MCCPKKTPLRQSASAMATPSINVLCCIPWMSYSNHRQSHLAMRNLSAVNLASLASAGSLSWSRPVTMVLEMATRTQRVTNVFEKQKLVSTRLCSSPISPPLAHSECTLKVLWHPLIGFECFQRDIRRRYQLYP